MILDEDNLAVSSIAFRQYEFDEGEVLKTRADRIIGSCFVMFYLVGLVLFS